MSTEITGYNRQTLLAMLESRIVEIKFRKVSNDEIRVLRGTLREDMIPSVTKAVTDGEEHHPDNPHLVTVWDLDAEGWRSIRTDRIIDVL